MNLNSILNNSYLLIDTDALRENARTILRELPSGTKLIPVLKDDAYGMGMVEVARQLALFPEIDCFAVAHGSEGVTLRREGIRQDILVMAGALPHQLEAVVTCDLTLTVARLGVIAPLAALAAAHGKQAQVQIKIETGLHRIGLEVGPELAALAEELHAAGEHVRVTGAFSHFAEPADEARCTEQTELFRAGTAQLEAAGIALPVCHISGSETTELMPQFAMDAVRVGRRLYMDHPTAPRGNIREAVSWRCGITAVKARRAGETLSYGGAFHLTRDTLVATIDVGYGDGLNEALVACHAPVLVRGVRCPLLACCMDQSFVDVTAVGAEVGDEVTLFGHDGAGKLLSSQEVAGLIGANEGCGLTSALSSRVARVYE